MNYEFGVSTNLIPVFQGLGGAYLVAAAQSAFLNQMKLAVLSTTPDIDQATLVLTGATEIRNSFPESQQGAVIDGYMDGLKVVFAICIAATGFATVVGLASRWSKLGKEVRSGAGMA